MNAIINGVVVNGTPQEIATLIAITGSTSTFATSTNMTPDAFTNTSTRRKRSDSLAARIRLAENPNAN